MKVMGVIYHKDPLACLDILNRNYLDASNYIILHLQNQSEWKKMLEGVIIDPDRCMGVSLETLEQYGAVIPNPVPDFTLEEMFYILARRYNHFELEIKDIMKQIGRTGSTPDIMKFNSCRNRKLKEIGDALRNRKK